MQRRKAYLKRKLYCRKKGGSAKFMLRGGGSTKNYAAKPNPVAYGAMIMDGIRKMLRMQKEE